MSKSELIYLDSDIEPLIEISPYGDQAAVQADRAYRMTREAGGDWQREIAAEGERFQGDGQNFVVHQGKWTLEKEVLEKDLEEREYDDDYGL